MNPYYATGFLSALIFWVWPAFLFRQLDAPWATVLLFSAAIFLGLGKLATEFHLSFIAPRNPPRGSNSSIGIACFAIAAVAALTRFAYDAFTRT